MRSDGLRVRLSPIKGVTKGRTAKLLRPEFRFQCPPLDGLSHEHGRNHQRAQNYAGDEGVRRGGRRLASFPMRMLVVEYASFVTVERWDVEHMRDALMAVAEEGWPFRLLATHPWGSRPEIDARAILESVTVTEQANEVDARYLDLTFTQKDDAAAGRKTNRRSGAAKDWPFVITLREDGKYSAPSGSYFKTHGEPLTLEVVARYAYGMPSLGRFVGNAQRPRLSDWGVRTPLVQHPRFKHGGKVVVPEPPDVKTDRGGSVPRRPPVRRPDVIGRR